MGRILSPDEARAFYDRFGRSQDRQAFYEDRALLDLEAHGSFEEAESVLELGCGTGRLAHRLLANRLPRSARYIGLDLSATMVELSRDRLRPFGDRVSVRQTEGSTRLDLPDRSFDRVVSTYVLDLLPEAAIRTFLLEARRVLVDGGLLCLASLTRGRGVVSRAVTALWEGVHAVRPVLLGGCRPLDLGRYVSSELWTVRHEAVHVAYGIASQVLVAARAPGHLTPPGTRG